MNKQELIRAILREADVQGNTVAGHDTTRPLRSFGQVWWADGQWWFSEQRAEISLYTANGGSSSVFGEGQFEVKHLTDEELEQAKKSWDTYGGQLK